MEHSTGTRAFVGRDAELSVIASRVRGAALGRSALVWVAGDAGSGKTALVGQVVESLPSEFTVVRCQADELASEIPFMVAAQLGTVTSGDPFAAGMELLSQVGQLQQAGAVAAVVEDLQWADPASRLALLTMARRLDDDRVVIFVTSRPDPRREDGWEHLLQDSNRCTVLTLGSLSVDEVAELGKRLDVPLSYSGAARLHRHTGGHPLYVRTLLNELTPEQLATSDAELPVPHSLASTTIARLAELTEESRTLASALAVVNSRTPLSFVGRVAGLAHPTVALDGLLTTGFITWAPTEPGTPVEFTHPLYRAAVYDDLSPTLRQKLHLAAADLLDGGRALAHRVAAADSVDENLANELAGASRPHQESGAFGQAATYLLWASSLTAERPRHEKWLMEAARLLLRDGQTARVATMRDNLEACTDRPLRNLVLGTLAWDQGEAESAAHWLARAGETGAPPDVRAEALALLGTLHTAQIRGHEALVAAREALSIGPADPEVEQSAWTALSLGTAMIRGAPAGLELLEARLKGAPETVPAADAELLIIRGTLGFFAGRYTAAISDLRSAINLVHRGATAKELPRAHVHLSQALFEVGHWDDSLVHARIALSLTAGERTTWVEAQAHAAAGTLLASRGEWDGALEQVAKGLQAAEELGTVEARSSVQITQAAFARAQDDPAGVVQTLQITDDITTVPMIASLSSYPALVMALLDSGDVDGAVHQLNQFEKGAEARHLDAEARILGLRASMSASRGETAEAEAGFRQAIGMLSADDPLLDRARVHQEYGRLLRKRGNRKEAVEQLRKAHELLAGVGAEPFLRRVSVDLEACGIRSGPQTARTSLRLTEREQDVAALVAKGMTNREAATELYVSEKAVEYHLRNIFGKLDITSRRDLRKLSLVS